MQSKYLTKFVESINADTLLFCIIHPKDKVKQTIQNAQPILSMPAFYNCKTFEAYTSCELDYEAFAGHYNTVFLIDRDCELDEIKQTVIYAQTGSCLIIYI